MRKDDYIEYLPLKRVTEMHGDEIQDAVNRVVHSGWYLQGKAVDTFEQQYAKYNGKKHCVCCANGLDALTLMLRAYKELGVLHDGDEVIVPANTYIATIISVTANHLKPILIEPRADTLQINDQLIEQAITPHTRAILIVHLYGRQAYTPLIGDICQRYNLLLFEDCAQGHGLKTHGNAQAHSFYPGKNLGALGDAGAVTTDDDEIAATIRALGNYGSSRKYVFPYIGRNSRMDEIQAAVLSVKLKYLDQENKRREDIALYYYEHIDNEAVSLPYRELTDNVFHIFPIFSDKRDLLKEHLRQQGIETIIHYPIPPHKQECYAEWNHLSFPITERIHRQELSLPCNQTLSEHDIIRICEAVNSFKTE